MLNHRMPMSLVFNHLQIKARVALMCGPELMMPDDFFIRDLLPFRGADVVLGVDQRVANEADM